ncbi:hypothetical protein AALP_AA7G151100 [Arabis alpina]|uniref:Uncharacterized protein n=1 Tax=Arabis alpina TaxID=50452 RepID=A0A087GI61_ARAAL|nr:hypothetical protein AALP_AA7G151100 [Arabis alpina]
MSSRSHRLSLPKSIEIGSSGMVGNDMIVAIGAQTGCLVIDDHPTKDRHWINYFFYVKISEASVGPSGFPSCPDGLFTDFLYAEMAAQERAQAENLVADAEVNPAGGQGGGIQDQPIVSDEVSESPVRAVLTDGISESVIDNSKTAAWFANIQYHGHEGPLPVVLVADPDFGLMSRHGSRLRRAHRGEVSRKSCSDAQTRLGIEMDHRKSVESELQVYQWRCVEAEERAIEESAKALILQWQLADEKTGITSRIKRATKAAMHTFATKFQGKIDRAKEKIKALGGNPKKKLVQLALVEANIEFARILREAPNSFDAEAAKVEAWPPNVAGGDVEFDSLFAGLDSDLVISPITSHSSGTARDNVSLETLAADVGIRTFDGSMTDELGVNHDDDENVNIDD